VPNPATLTAFFADVIGLVPSEPAATAATATWRNDNKAHRLTIQPGPAIHATLIGFEAVEAAAFDRVAGRLRGSLWSRSRWNTACSVCSRSSPSPSTTRSLSSITASSRAHADGHRPELGNLGMLIEALACTYEGAGIDRLIAFV
jgi:hypothetical protein